MPWCEGCDRFYNPNSLAPDGTCRSCGAQVGGPVDPRPSSDAAEGASTGSTSKAPWHFKLLVSATVVYLGYRFAQGVGWVIHHV